MSSLKQELLSVWSVCTKQFMYKTACSPSAHGGSRKVSSLWHWSRLSTRMAKVISWSKFGWCSRDTSTSLSSKIYITCSVPWIITILVFYSFPVYIFKAVIHPIKGRSRPLWKTVAKVDQVHALHRRHFTISIHTFIFLFLLSPLGLSRSALTLTWPSNLLPWLVPFFFSSNAIQ